jgi:exopolysaccharide biosynthesis polyprenyl glycosylphosphotransferase
MSSSTSAEGRRRILGIPRAHWSSRRRLGTLIALDVCLPIVLMVATEGLSGRLSGRELLRGVGDPEGFDALVIDRAGAGAIGPFEPFALLLALLTPIALSFAAGYPRRRPPSAWLASIGVFLLVAACLLWPIWLLTAAVGWDQDFTQLVIASIALPIGWIVCRLVVETLATPRQENVIVVGSGVVCRRIAALAERHPERGMRVIGFLDDAPFPMGADGPPYLGETSRLDNLLAHGRVNRVIVAFSDSGDELLLQMLRDCDRHGVEVDIVPRLFDLIGLRPRVASLGGLTLISASPEPADGAARAIKRAIDVVVSGLMIIIFAPLIVAIAVAILVDDGRPVIFRQERVGRHGRTFMVAKFRTMRSAEPDEVEDSRPIEEVVDAVKRAGAVRVTRVGDVLRRTSLDELPQLWNVLAGEMSLVGPRPLRPFEVDALERWQMRRQDVRPGVTGLWQVLGRSDVQWGERMQLDYSYVRHWSVLADLKILFRTVPAVMRKRGAV